ncbi:hypothetical protein ACFX10_006929 [Malus domestica]
MVGGFQGNQRPRNDMFAPTYNPGWRNHPNFKWGNNNNVQNLPPPQATPSKPLEDIISTLTGQVSSLAQSTHDLKVLTQAFMNKTDRSIANLETQVGQIAAVINQREPGKLPSQVVVNPKDLNNAQVNVITLRSGNELKSTKEPQQIDELVVVQQEEEEDCYQHHKESKLTPYEESTIPAKLNVLKVKSKPSELNSNPKVEGYTPPMPYPSRFVNSKTEQLEEEFLETIKNLEIAIPFFKAIKHIPSYAKFIKELCTNKWLVELNALVAFGEKVSLVLQ